MRERNVSLPIWRILWWPPIRCLLCRNLTRVQWPSLCNDDSCLCCWYWGDLSLYEVHQFVLSSNGRPNDLKIHSDHKMKGIPLPWAASLMRTWAWCLVWLSLKRSRRCWRQPNWQWLRWIVEDANHNSSTWQCVHGARCWVVLPWTSVATQEERWLMTTLQAEQKWRRRCIHCWWWHYHPDRCCATCFASCPCVPEAFLHLWCPRLALTSWSGDACICFRRWCFGELTGVQDTSTSHCSRRVGSPGNSPREPGLLWQNTPCGCPF